MKHVKTSMLVVAAAAALSLFLVGCTTTAQPQTATQEQAVDTAQRVYENNSAGEPVAWTTDAGRTDTAGAGYRGNGGSNAGTGYSDDCITTDTEAVEATNETLTSADLTATLAGYGSSGALNDNDLSLADMLTYAIQDEYAAHAEYAAILEDFGSVRPFSNIIRSEETHISTLLPLFSEYGIAAPADDGADHAVVPDDLTSAYQTGVNAEITNIAMYDLFLEQELPDDVRTVFESLMHASENHLRAFQNQL